ATDRAHVLEGLSRAIDVVDAIIAAIRATKGSIADAKAVVMEKFDFDEPQAAAIVAFRIGQLAGLEIEKIMHELEELHIKIKDFNEILMEIVKEEVSAIGEKFADKRKTDIEAVSGEVDIEDLIPQTDCVVTLTHYGYVKRMPADTYKSQRRGGRGIMGMTRREEDFVTDLFFASSHDYIMFFTDRGRMHRLKAYEISEASRTGKGINIVNLLNLEQGEKVTSTIKVSEIEEEMYLSMVTKNGIIKRTALSSFKNVRKAGLIAINLDEGDLLAFVVMTTGNDELLVATRQGRAVRFNENEARELSRAARGVKAVNLSENDYIVGVEVISEDKSLLTVSISGQGRRSDINEYPARSRGTKGVINYYTEKNGEVAAVKAVTESDDVIIIADDGVIIRIPAAQINMQSRYAGGVRVMRLSEGSTVVAIEAVPHEEEAEEDLIPNLDSDDEDQEQEENQGISEE
ncbi:MAG: DNA gyrase C-terminal beta-propeller domain-containing protein, partial [Oscillospiraceae bacterium]